MTLDEPERPKCILAGKKSSYEAHQKKLNEPYYQLPYHQWSMILVSTNITLVRILAGGSLDRGHRNDSRVLENGDAQTFLRNF